jgi:two-component system OmpR family sensor kinase/two-component system phosphate regulon sensor histidine kinase PhoR
MKLFASYNRKWLFYSVTFFLFFAVILLISEFFHERKFRIDVLNEKLDNYAWFVNSYNGKCGIYADSNYAKLDSLLILFPSQTIRITLINFEGHVLYDSEVKDALEMENHLYRPEIQEALKNDAGTDIRISNTTKSKYYYYVRRFDQCFIRVSDLYDMSVREFIKPDRLFLTFIFLILLSASLAIVLITDKFGKSISTLREFTLKALANKPIGEEIVFPQNELGDIGQEIIEIYKNLNHTKEELLSEKAKLIRHLNMFDEGIAIFSKDRHVITSNNNFIRFINYISDVRVFTADEFFRIADFNPIFNFIDRNLQDAGTNLADFQPTYEVTMNKGGRYFSVKCIVFQDRSFEVTVNDISKLTKRKLLKQQLTDNIAHELKTPVSSIKGFLETILEGNPDKARITDYLRRAYSQSCRLADLVNDISLLTKMEEAASLYQVETVNLNELVGDIIGEIESQLEVNEINLEIVLPQTIVLHGNSGLLYSVFRNLFDNSITYAGKGVTVKLENYMADEEQYYFSYYDTGGGVPEEDLPRLFERFYRVDKGRDRKQGGTGLGLAIVKNAIQFHKGDISVKNRTGGGLEFLFTLARDLSVSRD